MSRSRSSSRGGSERATLIAKLVSWFDSYVELNTVDPIRIQRSLKGYEGTDLDQIWKSVKNDVEQIKGLPSKSHEIEKIARRASRTRQLSMIVGAATFVVLIISVYYQNLFKLIGGKDLGIAIPGIVLTLFYALLMMTLLSTRSLNKAMRGFYDEHSGQLTKQKTHMREATQQLIDRLSREVYTHDFDPNKFKFQLFHSNYKNVTVVGRSGTKFVSTIKARNQPQK